MPASSTCSSIHELCNGTSQQMIHRRIRVGIHTLCAEIAILGIAYQQALTLQVAGNAVSNSMGQSCERVAKLAEISE